MNFRWVNQLENDVLATIKGINLNGLKKEFKEKNETLKKERKVFISLLLNTKRGGGLN